MKFACGKKSPCVRCGVCCHIRDKAIMSPHEDKELRRKIYDRIGVLYIYPMKRYTISISHDEKDILEKAAKLKKIELVILPKKIRIIEGKYVVMDWFLDHDVCPFFSEEKGCSIYEHRPAVCRAFPNAYTFTIEKEKSDVIHSPFDDALAKGKKTFSSLAKHMM